MAKSFFRPRLLDALHDYDRGRLIKDIGAGVTVGVVALPLGMAFAIASGLKPEAGLFTAIIAGFLISALGGSRVQIGGPAGAFIVIVYGIVQQYGVANLLLATLLSGLMLFVMGLLRLGTLVRFIPVSVVIGFTNGIAVLILFSQIKDFLGLDLSSMPADFFGMIHALASHLDHVNPSALGLALISLATLLAWQHFSPGLAPKSQFAGKLSRVPGSIVVLVLATLFTVLLGLPIETIGSRFGGIPAGLPELKWPAWQWASVQLMLMPAFSLAMLGAIESLMCARIADGLSSERHNPNQELMAQGIANAISPLFGGMPATGTIARTVTNIKSGATSPVAGIVHALTLLAVVLLASPLAAHVPLAALAAILIHVAWNMGDWKKFSQLRQFRLPYRVALLGVFVLTLVVNLTVAVQAGLMIACLTFIYRIAKLSHTEEVQTSPASDTVGPAGVVLAFRLHGALFFGAVRPIEDIETRLPVHGLALDFQNLIYLDSSGIEALDQLLKACQKSGTRLVISGLKLQPLDIAQRSGWLQRVGTANCLPELDQALHQLCPSG